MSAAKILVVEDELIVGQDIVEHLSNMGYEVFGPIDNFSGARHLLEHEEIDLALIDIKLSGEKDGVDLATFIRSELDIPFIFLSSVENQSIVNKAKSVLPSAYLLKPFNAKAVSISIDVALANHSLHKNSNPEIKHPETEDVLPLKKHLFLRKEHHFQRVLFTDISWIAADGNYTRLHTSNGQFVQTIQLSKVENRLPGNLFKRVHRSYIVNIEAVTGFMGNTLFVNAQKIPVSAAYREEIFHLFDTI